MRTRLSRILLACGVVLLIVMLWTMVGCASAVKQVHDSANKVTELAADTKTQLADATATGEVGPAAQPHLDQAAANQDGILAQASKIHTSASQTVDKVSPWVAIIRWGLIALAILGACFALWYTGVGFIVKRALLAFGMLIPAKVRQAVDLDAEALEEHPDSPAVRAAVAGKRAASAEYDAAWKKRKKVRVKRAVEAGLAGRPPADMRH